MRVIRKRLDRLRKDEGFTLVEMIVTVSILGVIGVVLFGVVMQYLKVSGSTRARLIESTDQQFISTYWQADVSSLGRRTFNPGNSDPVPSSQSVFVGTALPGGCGSSAGTVVIGFAWLDYTVNASVPANAWNSSAQEVAYVTVDNGSQKVLKRVRCKGGVAGDPLIVAHNLTAAPTIACDTTCTAASLPNRVTMQFNVRDLSEGASAGYTTTVTADRRQG